MKLRMVEDTDSISNIKAKLAEIQKDISILRKSNSVEDAFANGVTGVDMNFVSQKFKDDEDYPEFERMSDLLNFFKSNESYWKDKLEEAIRYEEKAKEICSEIETLSQKYNLIDRVDTGDKIIYVFEPTSMSHEECINFADDVAQAINGHYAFTGRGGSWFQWHIRSDSGVEIEVGWASSFEPKKYEDKWVVVIPPYYY